MKWFASPIREKPDDGGGAAASSRPLRRRPRIGIALGAGAARGWSHIGVLRELEAAGIAPDVIAGASAGAVVGACFSAGRLDDLEECARGLTRRRMLGFFDFAFSGSGLIRGTRLKAQLERMLGDIRIEDLPGSFAAIATEMGAGHEVWLTNGHLITALRASYALPGLFEPVRVGERWLLDGALVNPVPISACRALGADFVIAVNMVSEKRWRAAVEDDDAVIGATLRGLEAKAAEAGRPTGGLLASLARPSGFLRGSGGGAPGMATAMVDALYITQDRITRSRLAGDPPDVMINTRLGGIGLFDFHRAGEMIELGREAARRTLPEIHEHMALLVR
jgi:NTE family protein